MERRVLVLTALVQFINIWDFMVVMPLGPDFARALNFDIGHVGWLAGSYSVAGTISGIIASQFLDRLDRRMGLMLTLSGLSLVTAFAAWVDNFEQMILVRACAGLFGGPLMALSYATISDIFPPERRGAAMGKVMGSFAIAAIFGVPLALEIASMGGWAAPFRVIAIVGAVGVFLIRLLLPSLTAHRQSQHLRVRGDMAALVRKPLPLLGFAMISTSTLSAFLIIPNISAHVQLNLGYPRESLGLLYFCGGIASLIMTRVAGRLADSKGYTVTSSFATAILLVVVLYWFALSDIAVPTLLYFTLFMATMSVRNVTGSTILTRIPPADKRAGYMSLVSSLQHFSSGTGAFISAQMLTETPEGMLAGMNTVAFTAMVFFALTPCLIWQVEKRLKATRPSRPSNDDIPLVPEA